MTRPQCFGLQVYTRLRLEDEEAFTRALIERKCSPSELARELIHKGLKK